MSTRDPVLRRLAGLPPGRPPADPTDYAVTPERVALLSELIGEPSRYTQRLVEQLSFVPTGGQRWTRSLQIEIPRIGEPEKAWRIVALGQFSRKRLADIEARDAKGAQLNLLTRNQHGDSLAEVVASKYAAEFTEDQLTKLGESKTSELAATLRARIYDYFTTLSIPQEEWTSGTSEPLALIEKAYKALLEKVEVTGTDYDERVGRLRKEFADAAKTTPYLCWVTAYPGEVINLQVSYSTIDLKYRTKLGSLLDLVKAIGRGAIPIPSSNSRTARSSWHRQYGLAPIDYDFSIPRGRRSPGSYYFTLEPPDNTDCLYLDWEIDNSFNENREVAAAFPAAHLHADHSAEKDPPSPGRHDIVSGKIRAYLRCAPHHHKQILGAALLNIVIMLLLAKGKISGGFDKPLQGLVIIAPSALLAFLAQQQRHYYAHVMRRQRAILWTYLAISVAFLVLAAFGGFNSQVQDEVLKTAAAISAWALAISSAGVFGWHLLLGSSYERAVKYFADRKREMTNSASEGKAWHRRQINRVRGLWWKGHWRFKGKAGKDPWECYADAVRMYGNVIYVLTVSLIVGAALSLLHYGSLAVTELPITIVDSDVKALTPDTNPPPDTSRRQSGG